MALAQAFGAAGFTVSAAQDAGPALQAALATDGPAVIDVRSSLEHISAYTTIQAARGT